MSPAAQRAALQPARRMGRGRDRGHRPRGGRGRRHLRREDPRPPARHRHRHDLLHAAERRASGRGAPRPRRATSSTAARSGSTATPSPCRPPRRRRAALRRVRHPEGGDRGLSARRGAAATAFRRPSSIPAISSARAGIRSTRPAISTPPSSPTLARGEELALPNFGLETVHHVHADDVAAGLHAGDRQLERRGRRVLPRRLAAGGDAARLCRGDGRLVRPRAETRLPALRPMEGGPYRRGGDRHLGTHRPQPLLQHRRRPSGSSATARATPPSPPSRRRSRR